MLVVGAVTVLVVGVSITGSFLGAIFKKIKIPTRTTAIIKTIMVKFLFSILIHIYLFVHLGIKIYRFIQNGHGIDICPMNGRLKVNAPVVGQGIPVALPPLCCTSHVLPEQEQLCIRNPVILKGTDPSGQVITQLVVPGRQLSQLGNAVIVVVVVPEIVVVVTVSSQHRFPQQP